MLLLVKEEYNICRFFYTLKTPQNSNEKMQQLDGAVNIAFVKCK